MNAKSLVFCVYVKVVIYLLLDNFYDCTYKMQFFLTIGSVYSPWNDSCTFEFGILSNIHWEFPRLIFISHKFRLESDSHIPKKRFYLLQWKPFKNDEKFLFYFKSSFPSQDIYTFVLTFWSYKKTAWLERLS